MAKMILRSNAKPPLARSPIRLRPIRSLQSTVNTTTKTPPGSLPNSQLPKRNWDKIEPDLRPEYRTISCELRSLAKMVHQEFGTRDYVGFDGDGFNVNSSCLFERGRFYEEYSARRNEMLKRKKGEEEKKAVYDLGVKVDSSKKSGPKKFESRKKTAAAAMPMLERREAAMHRYSLRGCRNKAKENEKPPPLPLHGEKSCISERKVGVRKVRKK
ncbi:Hypothetical predicted protein [Olea europaea subsp. europaea]|uniref:Uncharacterized protein n=1 Tax=Olea europaea subsp. europaea TaxID=158383 RepID=A0A8S0TZN1_OLEEU|nr:Hypothetical predicted protein [Olea europaea subsp. europaea]